MTYADAIRFLYDLRWFGTKLGLENTRRLAELAGNPQDRLRFIHVAGTNGKGSTCAMLESIYRAAGYRVGLFTSPHLVSFAERIQVNREPIAEGEVVHRVEELRRLLGGFAADHHPTFFEAVTVMALEHFVESACDLVIWETGLGGRLDATNIVTPLACVITNIQMDHEKWLGNSLAQIASEKAGILKPGVPVATATTAQEALEVIERIAQERGAPLRKVTAADTERPPLDRLELPLLGDHQRLNAALALAAVDLVEPKFTADLTARRQGLSTLRWPGRLQIIRREHQILVLDGAHNPAGAASLRAALLKHFLGSRLTLILGILQDKDWQHMCAELAPLASRIYVVPVHSDRTSTPVELVEPCRRANPQAAVIACSGFAEAIAHAAGDPLVVITGSLYLVGEALELLSIDARQSVGERGERGLNEWQAQDSR